MAVLDHIVCGLPVWTYLVAMAGIIGFFHLWSWLARHRPEGRNTYRARCKCGWQGEASKVTKRCPKCLAILD